MTISRRASRNFLSQLAMLGVSFADRILFTGLLLRAWGTDTFSDWATLLAAGNLLVASEFGYQIVLGNSLVKAANRGRRRAFNRLVGLGMFFYLALCTALLTGMAAFVLTADLRKFFELVAIPRPVAVFAPIVGYVCLRIARTGLTQIYRGKGEVHRIMWTEVRAMAAIFVVAAVAVVRGAGPQTVALIYLGVEAAVGGIWTLAVIRRGFADVALAPRLPRMPEVREIAAKLPWYGWFGTVNHVMVQVPVLLVAWLGLGGAPLTALVVQRTLVNFGKNIIGAVSLAVGIEIADAGGAADSPERKQAIFLLARSNVALAALMAAGLLSLGDSVVGAWTGRPDLGSWSILFWLLFPVVLSGPAIPLQIVTFYAGVPRPQAIASAAQVFVGLTAAWLAGIRFGAAGVAFGIGLGEAVGMGIVLPILAASHASVRYLDLLRECAAFFVGALAWGGLAGWGVDQVFDLGEPYQLVAGLACWVAVGAVPVVVASIPRPLRVRLFQLIRLRLPAAGPRL